MTRREYYKKLKENLEKGYRDYQTKKEEYNELVMKNNSGHYDIDYINKDIMPRIYKCRRDLENIQERVKRESEALTEVKIKDLEKADRLNPEDITGDVMLLQGNIPLKVEDLKGILERNPENRTVRQMAIRYAEQNGLDLKETYIAARTNSKTYNSINGAVRSAVNMFDRPEGYNQIHELLFGENSELTDFCNSDSEE